ncbi:MAG: hypothetical protein HOV66_30550 [Streptomycetaceae bacterium]|nr:hypothetical protein [Streptomycetaceae bacterium]
MRPPYDPEHPESVNFAPGDDGQVYDRRFVVARCGRHFTGPTRRLATGTTARELAEDFNAHRLSYVQGESA